MATREAACHCGQLRLEVAGDSVRGLVTACLSASDRKRLGMQAAFKRSVQVVGRFSDFARISDEADRKEHVFHFCPDCGSQVFYTEPTEPDLIVVAVGSFADPSFPPPTESGYDSRRHHWVELPSSIQRYAPELSGHRCSSLRRRQVRGGGGQGPRAHRGPPRPGVPLLQRGVLREPRGQDSRRGRAPAPALMGGVSRHGEAGLRLRSDPRRARVRRTDRQLTRPHQRCLCERSGASPEAASARRTDTRPRSAAHARCASAGQAPCARP